MKKLIIIVIGLIGLVAMSSCKKEDMGQYMSEPEFVEDVDTVETIQEYQFNIQTTVYTSSVVTTTIKVNGEDVTNYPTHSNHQGLVQTNDTIDVRIEVPNFEQVSSIRVDLELNKIDSNIGDLVWATDSYYEYNVSYIMYTYIVK